MKNTINTAVQQRTAVGLVGLLVALYSGINWMGNLREAIRAQSRDVWERRPQDEEKIWVKYFRDLISLIGLLVALIITLSITSVAGSAQQMIISALYLDNIEWLKPASAANRPRHLDFCQLSALFLDFLAPAAPSSAAQGPVSRHAYRGDWL